MIRQLVCCLLAAAPLASTANVRRRRQDDVNDDFVGNDSLPPPQRGALPPLLDNLPPLGDPLPPPPSKRPSSFSSDKEDTLDISTLDTLAKLVTSMPEFSTLATALNKVGLIDSLASGGIYTLFAPTNEAFEKLPPATLGRLMGNMRQLKEVLSRHLIQGNFEEKHLQHGYNPLSPIGGEELAIILSESGGELRSGYAQASVLQFDILASNGVMHVIDTVV